MGILFSAVEVDETLEFCRGLIRRKLGLTDDKYIDIKYIQYTDRGMGIECDIVGQIGRSFELRWDVSTSKAPGEEGMNLGR